MKNHYNYLKTEELKKHLNNRANILIDARPIDAYNGWKLKGEKRGGHISGAKSLPVKWTNYIDWIEIVRSKGMEPGHDIIVYGYDQDEAEDVARMFEQAGYEKISIYPYFLNEWTGNHDLPMEQLERYRRLVYPQWVKSLISSEKPPEYDNDKYVICHAHYRNPADYEIGHIPGAIALDTLELESPETWNRRSPQELKENLEMHGITHDTTVVLYGRFSFPKNEDPFPGSSAGQLAAIRCAAIMMYAGVKDVRVLNGGVQSWLDEGFRLTKVETLPEALKDFGTKIPANPELFVDTDFAKEMLRSKDAGLVCIRSWNEYIGEVSGYNYIEKKGRIPGAIFGNCGTDAYHMENYRNLDHTIREFHEVSDIWRAENITPDKHLAFYCGTGWRGSEAFYNAWLMGWPKVSVYDGGWFEWSNDPKNPVETGVPEE
ncbi:MAG: hypothetical protein K9G67_11295 [Bacteroidales bacterium]|nr:hypothetical protein [Bacteroidales bacterium]MCF8343493.1 hypothetical protein [Bacteroidales bacterium]MCF8352109.1 hypothetical protein [Bacteroidales bacterium]MCF8376932.1 hypothetical protein [Bacteroidales bacterium]MCF8402132.1 hypothetical protein [Bacteroidales bacterium]